MLYICPNNCEPEDPTFYYPPCCLLLDYESEEGVIIYADGEISNQWTSGCFGVPERVKEDLENHDCLPHCFYCYEEATIKH